MDKGELPPSGDIHDYLSLAPYRWPDPSKKDGLPYIGRDGRPNPEIYTIPDKKNLDDLTHAVKLLSQPIISQMTPNTHLKLKNYFEFGLWTTAPK